MKTGWSVALFVAGVCSLSLRAVAVAADFSADVKNTIRGRSFEGKIYSTRDKVRMEMAHGTTIAFLDRHIVLVLMPEQKVYMEQPLSSDDVVAVSEQVSGETGRKLLGSEEVAGWRTQKYEVTYRVGGRSDTLYQWFAEGIPVPVKTAAKDGSWAMEYDHIVVGRQPDSLFTVPADYRKVSMPGMGRAVGE